MASRNFSIMEYLNVRCSDMEPLCGFSAKSETDARRWRSRAIAKVRDLLGEMPEPVQLHPETIESVDMGSYVREKVIFDSDTCCSVPGYILIPKGTPHPVPAILCLHGHGPGKDPVAGITTPDDRFSEEAKRQAIQTRNYDYARQFAERGYVTFTFDFWCFGERGYTPVDLYGRDPCNVHFIRGSILGVNLLTLGIGDTMRAVDYLSSRPEVDPQRIGCMGLSFGGTMTLWSAAMDKRIKAALISGYLCEYESFAVNKANFCGSQIVPMLRRYFDMSDIAALIAPRPLLIESGTLDDGFPIESADRAYEKLKLAYKAYGKPDYLDRDVFQGGHQFSGRKAFDWFDKWL